MTLAACSLSQLPKRNYQPAAHCNADFEAACKLLGIRPRRYFLKEGRGWYWLIGVTFSSGRYGTLCKWEDFPETIEISLELVRDVFFYEQDLLEVLSLLNVQVKDSARQGAYEWKAAAKVRTPGKS